MDDIQVVPPNRVQAASVPETLTLTMKEPTKASDVNQKKRIISNLSDNFLDRQP
jgi:hypothetical protein